MVRLAFGRLVFCTMVLAACARNESISPPQTDRISIGTWGGENAGLIVDDTVGHAHIGCTYGNFRGPVLLDQSGRFSVAGEYVLRAFPVQFGPPVPAVFNGVVSGGKLTLTVAVNDTVEKKQVQLGPVTLTYGKEPKMGPCPICRKPRALALK